MKKFLVICGVCVAALLCIGAVQYHEDQQYTLREVPYTVQNGDTMWGIAEKHMPKQNRTDNVNRMMYNISEANREVLHQYPTLRAGQVLVIPLETHK